MAQKFLTPIDLNKNELQNAKVQNLATAPATPGNGQVYFDTTIGAQMSWNGTAWIPADATKASGIPNSALATNPLARANHTGSQLAATISDFNAAVRTNSLDQMAAPAADVALNSKKITGLADPVSAQDAASKNYVDGAVQSAAAGIDSKPSVRVYAVANIALTGLQTIDGISVIAGDRVLAGAQTTGSQNGVYVAASGAWARATDADQTGEVTPGAFWFVEEGTTYGKTQWRCNNTGAVTLGTTAITIVQFGAAGTYSASNGVLLTGSNLTAVAAPSGGLSVGASGVAVDRSLTPQRFAVTFGDGSAASYVLTHNLNTQDVIMEVLDVTSKAAVWCDMVATSVNTVTLSFSSAPAANSLRCVVIG